MISLESVLKEVPKYRGIFVGGQWQLPKLAQGTFEVVSPANLEWKFPKIGFSYDLIGESVAQARKALTQWQSMGLHGRAEMLRKFSDEIGRQSQRLGSYVAVETGKPLDEALSEVQLLQNKVHVTIEHASKLVASQSLDLGQLGQGEIHWRPKGVLAIIGPFNMPLHLPHGHIVPALLMGNAVIFKPSDKTPFSAQAYLEAAEKVGFPPGVLQLLQGPGDVATRLIREPGVDGVVATCSVEVGVKIQKELADFPEKLIALEMGGKNAAIVLKTADIEKTAQAIIRSAYSTAGQRCTALSRVYVEGPMMDALIDRVHHFAKDLVVSHPFDSEPKPFMGPLISASSVERFFRYSKIAEGEGADVVMRSKHLESGGRQNKKPIPQGHYVTPSIHRVDKWNAKSPYQSHEIFGPDVFFAPINDLDDGLNAVNSSHYGLVASVFGGNSDKDREHFHRIADRIECGLVYWNRATVGASALLPFGGWKKSGNHRPAGIFSIYATVQVQSRIL